jgi:hypothetical protein
MNLKYQVEISSFGNCPPQECLCCDRAAFRFVQSDILNPNNFLPQAKKPARRKFETDDVACSGYALSLFATREQAIAFYERLKSRYKKGPPIGIGTHLASGTISSTDGRATPVRDDGHFDLHEAEGLQLATRFKIVEQLP